MKLQHLFEAKHIADPTVDQVYQIYMDLYDSLNSESIRFPNFTMFKPTASSNLVYFAFMMDDQQAKSKIEQFLFRHNVPYSDITLISIPDKKYAFRGAVDYYSR